MLDLHTHILPGIDDGSRDIDMSIQMLDVCKNQGTRDIVFTPHFYASRTSMTAFLEKREKAWQTVKNAYDFAAAGMRPHLGAEVHFFRGIERSEEIRKLQIGETGCILLELPFEERWPEGLIDQVETLQRNQGLQVIIAHAERYVHKRNGYEELFDALLDTGAYIQTNANFFIRHATRKTALKLLADGKIQFLGSDAHDLKDGGPNLKEAAELIQKKCGEEVWKEFYRRGYTILRNK